MIIEISQYLRERPDATLKEYEEHLKQKRDEDIKAQKEFEKEEELRYSSYNGKYIMAKFNDQAYRFWHIKSASPFKIIADKSFMVVHSKSGISIHEEPSKDFYVNYLWFRRDSSEIKKMKEITEEGFEKIKTLMKDMSTSFENVLETL